MEESVKSYLPIGSEKLVELVRKNLFKPRMSDLAAGVYEQRAFAERVSTLPRFELTARPLKIPPELLTESLDSDVILRSRYFGTDFDTVEKKEFVLKLFREKIARQAAGYFELWDAAEILSSAIKNIKGERMSSIHMRSEMIDAFNRGTLTFYDEYGHPSESWWLKNFRYPTPGITADKSIPGVNGEATTPKAINAWLESTGSPHRFPEPTTPPAPPVVVESASGGVELLPATEPKRIAATGPVFSMVRAALVAGNLHHWPTIDRDLKDAAANGLSAAKAGARDWDETAALAWAKANNKLRNTVKPANTLTQAINSMSNLPSRKHTLKG